jgi:hypothetical protein
VTGQQHPSPRAAGQSSVDLYWLPLGSGGRCVRTSGRLYETLIATRTHRAPMRLYHSALIVRLDGHSFAIEMTPVWAVADPGRGVVAEGPVGMPSWGRSRLFRYEIRCWRGGTIPDLAAAVDSPRRLSSDKDQARRVLELVASFEADSHDQQTKDAWSVLVHGTAEVVDDAEDLRRLEPVARESWVPRDLSEMTWIRVRSTAITGRALWGTRPKVPAHCAPQPDHEDMTAPPMLVRFAGGAYTWLGEMPDPPERVYVVHGEPDAKAALADQVGTSLDTTVVVPRLGERVVVS